MKSLLIPELRSIACGIHALCLLAAPLAAQVDMPFSSGSTGADGEIYLVAPTARYDHAMVYDAARQNVFLFGGNSSNGASNGTYTWNNNRWTWLRLNSAPPARYNHHMAYDATRQQVVIFGGQVSGGYSNDTWTWDGEKWIPKTVITAPSPRGSGAMVYDAARQQVVLFGGSDDSGNYVNDTWVWDGVAWSQKFPATSPSGRNSHAMAYDTVRQQVVLFGGSTSSGSSNETWVWDGSNWTKKTPATSPAPVNGHAMAWDTENSWVVMTGGTGNTAPYTQTWAWTGTNWISNVQGALPLGRYSHAMAFDSQRKEMVVFGGYSPNAGVSMRDTQVWSIAGWERRANVDNFVFDMTPRANGVWNFTSITIGPGVDVNFKRNDSNSPVTWLASGPVVIDGNIILDGQGGTGGSVLPSNRSRGGPGGYDGGLGGTRFDQSGSYAGTPGQGPGGGAAGQTSGQDGANATHRTSYGNAYLLPLTGGSGGGGTASNSTNNGVNGGAGGGAILIASSRDITINGTVRANGGPRTSFYDGGSGFNRYSGHGSGGAVALVADRLLGSGTIQAYGGGGPNDDNGMGRIRLEGYIRTLVGVTNLNPPAVEAPPLLQRFGTGTNAASLRISQIAGQAVPQTLSGNFDNPDVIFQQAGSVNIVVTGTNLPDGTQVGCRITVGGQIINLPSSGTVTLTGGSATFSTAVPAGLGTIQAFTKNFTGQ